MSPFQIKIMLHYYYAADEYTGGEEAQAIYTTCSGLVRCGMLKTLFQKRSNDGMVDVRDLPEFVITEKGTAYVDMLKGVPVPVVQYVDPRTLEPIE